MVSSDLLELLRCPADIRNGPNAGLLDMVRADTALPFLVCRDCGRKYPIKNDIPIMLVEEGDKYQKTPIEELPPSPVREQTGQIKPFKTPETEEIKVFKSKLS